MKKKVITALLITMTLTLGGVGTVYAMDSDIAVLSGETANDVNVIKEGFIWVVDKEAVYETVHHEAVYETIHHEAEYKTVHHEAEGYYEKQQVQVGTKPIYEQQLHGFCYTCNKDIGLYMDPVEGGLSKDYAAHIEYHRQKGETNFTLGPKYVNVQVGEEPIYEEKEVWIETKPAWDEQILVREEYDEQILVREEYDEQVLVSPEEGHWEPVKDEEKPENPEQKPDEEKPETPEQKPDEEKPETPEQKPDEETPETPEQKPEEQTPEKPDNSNTDNRQDSTEDTSKDKTDNKTDNKKEDTNTVPKTGDPTNLAYLATLAGSALVGGVSWKSKKRK
ncbi:hypothetical protein [Blautia hansenii]|uniref:hypothetical protein n=1 Tax=Blautia hansenii TaxID=1322 RepID=UPI0022E5B6F0|nr:hypothetical protein [Blautia hansenii]